MTSGRADAEAQATFVALLATPLVTAASNPAVHRWARHHRRTLQGWAARCGYRIVSVSDSTRLHRLPLGNRVARPALFPPPSRRVLVLALAAATACEEGEPTTTIQTISDQVRDLTGIDGSPVSPYDPDRRAERVMLVRALELLERYGALRRRTYDEQLVRTWEDNHQGVGRGYEVERAAVLQLVDPAVVAAALAHDEVGISATSQRMLRELLETQAVVYCDLDQADAEWLRTRRARIAEEAAQMTGGTVEMRTEGLVLILPPGSIPDATVPWPRATTASWVALLLADAAMAGAREQVTDEGVLHVPTGRIDELVAQLHKEREAQLTRELREEPSSIRAVAETLLQDVGLLRVNDAGDWRLLPTAARYREPTIVVGRDESLEDDR